MEFGSNPTIKQRKILIATDEGTAAGLRKSLEELGHQVVGVASTGAGATDLAREHEPDLVLMDIVLSGDTDGIAAAAAIQNELAISSVVISNESDGIRVARAKQTRPAGYLFKPYDLRDLHCTLEVAFSRVDLQRELAEQTRKLEELAARRAQELERVQSQLFDSGRMEVVGALTGGIAHDVNNMLLPIMGYSNLLVEALEGQPELAKMASEINDAASSSTKLTDQLLAFSLRQIHEKEAVDINQLVEVAERMLTCIVGDRVSLFLELAEGRIPGVIDPGQIEQVLLNLCVNARDAMADGGTITVKTERLDDKQQLPQSLSSEPERDWMRITVTDNGRGMPPEVCERIFEPYFSTKGEGRAGLGLSVAQRIISEHDGHLEVESLPGFGTNFHIYLPVDHDMVLVEKKTAPAIKPVDDVRGTERILVIEDEPQVRALVANALTNKGYVIETAYDLESARRMLSSSRESGGYDLIFSDCVLPDGTGVECLIEQMREFPDTKAILSTGYTDQERLLEAAAEYDIGFLQKPYPLPKLFEIVRSVLDQGVVMSA